MKLALAAAAAALVGQAVADVDPIVIKVLMTDTL
jgi:hypothetical protein